MMHRGRATWFRTWAAQIVRRRGAKRAMVALARRIGVILHRMWVEDADFRSDGPAPHVARATASPTVACLTAGLRDPPRDAVPMTPWSGLLPATRSTFVRWPHRNCIEPASCWRPQRRPRTEACTRGDLRRRHACAGRRRKMIGSTEPPSRGRRVAAKRARPGRPRYRSPEPRSQSRGSRPPAPPPTVRRIEVLSSRGSSSFY
jgi:hypothetical protein